MLRPNALVPLLLAASLAACSDDSPTAPTDSVTPVQVTESFTDFLNPNGGRTHTFNAERAGTVQAKLISLAPDETATIGLSLGTWNGAACAIIIANDNASLASAAAAQVTGSATGTGAFCVRVYDVGKLTQNIEYVVTVDHF